MVGKMANRPPLSELLGDSPTSVATNRPPLEDILEGRVKSEQTQLPKKNTLGDVARTITTPLVSQQDVMQSQLGRFMAQSSPITQVGGVNIPPPFSQVIPPNIRTPLSAELISQQTSPLAIGSNIALGMGALKQANMIPQIMGKQYTLERAGKAATALDNLRTTLGETKKQAVGSVANTVVKNFKPTFPKQILDKLHDPLYEIEFSKGGAIKPTIGNLDKVKEALGDLMTSRGWEESTKKLQQSVKQSYGYIKNAMTETEPSIKEPISAYSKFMEKYGLVNRNLRDSQGNVLEKKIRGAFSKGSEEQVKKAWKELSKQSGELKQVASDMEKWAGRQSLKKWLSMLAGGGAGAYLAHRYLAGRVLPEQRY